MLVIDNYDSFVYNLVQYFGELGQHIEVVRNDAVSLEELEKISPERIVISPGPGIPEKAGICMDIVKKFSGRIPILGVCLGHQCIGAVFGGQVVKAEKLLHGKTSIISHNSKGIFKDIPHRIKVARYHSLVIKKETVPELLRVTAVDDEGTIMAVEHKKHSTFGIQFHPESIASEYGLQVLRNFCEL